MIAPKIKYKTNSFLLTYTTHVGRSRLATGFGLLYLLNLLFYLYSPLVSNQVVPEVNSPPEFDEKNIDVLLMGDNICDRELVSTCGGQRDKLSRAGNEQGIRQKLRQIACKRLTTGSITITMP